VHVSTFRCILSRAYSAVLAYGYEGRKGLFERLKEQRWGF
jgi:hypothetical protein